MRKQLIYFLFFVCLLMPSMAIADFDIDLSRPHYPRAITSGASITFTVTVSEDGNPVSGQTVTFTVAPDAKFTADEFASLSPTSATTDSNGQAQTTLSITGDTPAHQYRVKAELANGQSDSYSMPVGVASEGALLSLSVSSGTYNAGESVPVTFSLRKGPTNISGRTVTFSLSPDNGTASLSPTSATTDGNGEARTKVILGSNASGRYKVTATLDDGKSVSSSTGSVLNSGSSPSFILAMRIDEGAFLLNPGGSRTFTAIVQDNGFVSGQTVTFSVSPNDGTVSLSSTTGTTDSNGEAGTSLITGSDSSGSYTVTATLDNGQSVSYSATIGASSEINPTPEVVLISQEQQTAPETPADTEGTLPPNEPTTADTTPEESSTSSRKSFSPGQITFSELMYATKGGPRSHPQWIELHNNSDTKTVNLKGWHLEIEARDDDGTHRHAVIRLENLTISPNQTALIVTWVGDNSGAFPEESVYNFFNHHSDEFEQNAHRNMVLGRTGFYLKLSDLDGVVSDVVGNLDGNSETEDEPAWKLPSGTTENGARMSLMRRYNPNTRVPLDGSVSKNWVSASALQLSVMTYWGRETDIGNPGYRGEGALPVTLSHFRAERLDTGVVGIEWTTASELDNAGFNILRSQSKEGPYVKVNPALITGAGTTSERHAYIYRDSGVQPNIVYFYQIEDVSFSGVRQRLATTRIRGHISTAGKITVTWGGLKTQN